MACEYVRAHYGVPAEIGRRVIARGKPGVIARDRGRYLGILLDCDEPHKIRSHHPADEIEYLDEVGKVRQPSPSQARYQRFLEYGDSFDSFIDFCQWDGAQDRS